MREFIKLRDCKEENFGYGPLWLRSADIRALRVETANAFTGGARGRQELGGEVQGLKYTRIFTALGSEHVVYDTPEEIFDRMESKTAAAAGQ